MTLGLGQMFTRAFGIVLATVLLLSACATPNVDKDYSLDTRPDEGLAVVSISFEGLGAEISPVWEYRRLDGDVRGKLFTSARNPLDWNAPPGRLAAFALPTGRYEFYRCRFVRSSGDGGMSWHAGDSGGVTAANPWYSGLNAGTYDELTADPFAVRFEVIAGKATYLGNLHLHWRLLENRGEVQVRNEAERDIRLLRTRYPGLRSDQVTVSRALR